jgi:uncharacterized protein (TIGR03437 family)
MAFVSPGQVTFQVPAGVATGAATVNVVSSAGTQTASNIQVAAVAPTLFTLNGSGLAAAETIRVPAAGAPTVGAVYQASGGASLAANPISMGAATDQVYLVLFGTGLDAVTASNVTVTVGGVNATVVYAGAQGFFPGLDQVNVLLPPSLAGKGTVEVQLTASGVAANPVQIVIQ